MNDERSANELALADHMRTTLEISPESQAAIRRAYKEETREAAKEAVDLIAKDCIRHMLKPVAGLAMWILFAQETARRYA